MKILDANLKSFTLLENELRNNNPIIVPTDTNYNLCVLPDSNSGIDKIFSYKNRNKDKPLSLFLGNNDDWVKYGYPENKEIMEKLIDNFWPGPLNIIINNISDFGYMLNDNPTISVGHVKNSSLQKFLEFLKSPIAITSANISGTADDKLITIDEAIKQMGNKVNYLLKSKDVINSTQSSTIVKINRNSVEILRVGDIDEQQIKAALAEVDCDVVKR